MELAVWLALFCSLPFIPLVWLLVTTFALMIAGAWFEKRKIPRLSFKDASLSHNEPTERAPGDYALNANSVGLLYLA